MSARQIGRLEAAPARARPRCARNRAACSRASAAAARCGETVSRSSPRRRARRRRERVLGRAKHQRERRAELVADVAEERGLRAIELRQRLGARLRLFERLGAGDGGADLRRDERRESRDSRRRTAGADWSRQPECPTAWSTRLSRDRHQRRIWPGVEAATASPVPCLTFRLANTSRGPIEGRR